MSTHTTNYVNIDNVRQKRGKNGRTNWDSVTKVGELLYATKSITLEMWFHKSLYTFCFVSWRLYLSSSQRSFIILRKNMNIMTETVGEVSLACLRKN